MKKPVIADDAFIAPGAVVVGNVTMESQSSVWYNTTVRGDAAEIYIGPRSNVQDNCVIHGDTGTNVVIGSDVTIGHGAIVHGCTIGDHSLIGMGAIVLNNAHIGKNCLIGAGALITQGMEIPDGSVVMGSPAKIRRSVTQKDLDIITESAKAYLYDIELHSSLLSENKE